MYTSVQAKKRFDEKPFLTSFYARKQHPFTYFGIGPNISGGTFGSVSAIYGGIIYFSDGTVTNSAGPSSSGSTMYFSGGTAGSAEISGTMNLTGGTIGSNGVAYANGILNMSGGSLGSGFQARSGSLVVISGGKVGGSFDALDGSRVSVSGGTIGDDFDSSAGSQVTLIGGEFRINGTLVAGLDANGSLTQLSVPAGAVLSGTFADGTPFAFASPDGDSFAAGTVFLESAPLPIVTPSLVFASTDPVPAAIRAGQTLVVDFGANVGNDFAAGWGSTINVQTGGKVGNNFEAVGAAINIIGGTIGTGFDVFHSTNVNISGGSIGQSLQAFKGSTIKIIGGSIGGNANALDGSVIQIEGGTINSGFIAYPVV